MKMDSEEFKVLKMDIRAVLQSVHQGLTPSDLEKDYRAMIGKPMPLRKFGFSSALDLVKSIPDVVTPSFKAGGVLLLKAKSDPSTEHIAKLVSQQKKSSKVARIRPRVGPPPPRPRVPYGIRVKIKELMKSYPGGIDASVFTKAYAKRFGEEIKYKSLGFGVLKGFLVECQDILSLDEREKSIVIYCRDTMQEKSPAQMVEGCRTRNVVTKSDTSRNKIPSLSTSTAQTNSNISSKSPTYDMETCWSNPGHLSLDQPEGVATKSKITTARTGGSTGVRIGISEQLQGEISQIMEDKPNGIWSARLPFEYKGDHLDLTLETLLPSGTFLQIFKKPLDVQGIGFRSVIELAGSLPHIIRIERPAPESDWLLFSADMEICNNQILPRCAAGLEDHFKENVTLVKDNSVLSVIHVQDPFEFWFRLDCWEDEHNDLMSRLQTFYCSKEAKKFSFPDSYRRPGQVCCAVFEEDGHWYRAKVLGVRSANTTEVLFIDYGNTDIVTNSKLRLLSREFLNIPQHSLRGKLANIKVTGKGGWSKEATDYFYDLTCDRKLFGKCKGKKDDVISLELIDTNSQEDIFINSMLVVKGYAVYDQPVEEPKTEKVANKTPPGISTASQIQKQPVNANGPLNLAAAYQMNQYLSNCYLYSLSQMQAQLAYMQSTMITAGPMARPNMLPNVMPQFVTNQPMQNPAAVPMPPAQHSAKEAAAATELVREEKEPKEVCNHVVQNRPDVIPEEQSGSSTPSEDNGAVLDDKERMKYIVKRLYLPDDVILHAIHHNAKAHVTSAEVSSLFWHGDYLRAMLRQKKATFPKCTVRLEDHHNLVDELQRFDVKGRIENGKAKEFITLYEMESLSEIFKIFNYNSDAVKDTVETLVEQSKTDSFWETSEFIAESEEEEAVESDDQDYDEIASDSEDLALELEELKLLEQAMHFKRKRLFNALMTGNSTQDKVDALKSVETELSEIRAKITAKGGKL